MVRQPPSVKSLSIERAGSIVAARRPFAFSSSDG
jgi:hypothetical protein